MKRPLFLLLIGLVLGEAAAIIYGWKGFLILALLILLYGIIFLVKRNRQSLFYSGLFLLLSFFSGMCLMISGHRDQEIDWCLKQENKDGKISGKIKELKINREGEYQIVLKDSVFTCQSSVYSLHGSCRISKIAAKSCHIYPGDYIVVTGTLSQIEEPANPGEFNNNIYCKSMGIFYIFYGKKCEVEKRPVFSLKRAMYTLKTNIANNYKAMVSYEKAALLKAMVLGDKSDLTQNQRKLFEENGMAHLLAVSGLHVSLIGGHIYKLIRKRGAGYIISCLSGSAVLLLYGCMTGFGSSVLRAICMYMIFLLSQYMGAVYDMASSMSLSGILMLAEYPYRIMESGFIISYACIFIIGVVLPFTEEQLSRRKEKNMVKGEITQENPLLLKLKRSVFSGIMISLLTAPLIMFFYYEFTPYSFLLNIVILPLMEIFMISACAGGIMGLFYHMGARLLLIPARAFLEFLIQCFYKVEYLPGSCIVTGKPSVIEIILLYLFIILSFVGWYYLGKRILPGIMLLSMSLYLFHGTNNMRVIMLDIGQGDCNLVILPDQTSILIDGGSTSKSKIADFTIIPALKYYGLSHLDYVIITHVDEDHISGIEELMKERYPIAHFVMPDISLKDEKYDQICEERIQSIKEDIKDHWKMNQEDQQPVIKIKRGDHLNLGACEIHCLHPYESYASEDRNSYSTVLYVHYNNFDALFTGDLDEDGEKALCDYLQRNPLAYPGLINHLELLKVAHHGSRYSTTDVFLKYIKPKIAFISAGKNNFYGHPHYDLLKRLKEREVNLYQTLSDGALVLTTNGKEMDINTILH